MPELPEVETIKNALDLAVCGSKIIKTTIHCRRLRQPIPADFEKIAEGAVIDGFERIGKYIIVNLSNGKSLIWHMGMSGRVKIMPQCPIVLAKHDHVMIETNKGCLIFNDARRFGLLTWCATNDLKTNSLLCKTGLDPFDKTFNGEYLYSKFKNKKTAVKIALLDQEIIAGIGNIYASEALYAARILPTRPANSLSLKESQTLAEAVRQVLTKAIAAGGSTLKDYRKPDGSMGYFQNAHCVYGKTGQPCPDCQCHLQKKCEIQKIVLGGRSTFYCPILQK